MNINSLANVNYTSFELRPSQLLSNETSPLDQESKRPVLAVARTDVAGSESSLSTAEQDAETSQKNDVEKAEQERQEVVERNVIRDLSSRDREVRAHEQAHASVGGQYAGAPTYQFQRGPDGVNYAVGGEVSIDVSAASTPEETIRKMQIVRAAALAPAEPSPQDRSVAAQASATLAQAQGELARQNSDYVENSAENNTSSNVSDSEQGDDGSVSADERNAFLEPREAGVFTSRSSAFQGLSQSVLAASGIEPRGQLFNQLA